MRIAIKCETAEHVSLRRLTGLQEGLKSMRNKAKERLEHSILEQGLLAPVFVWDDNGTLRIIDGHQRVSALTDLKSKGHEIPYIPIVRIIADDIVDAKRKLLAVSSQYGEFDVAELEIWLRELGSYEYYNFTGFGFDAVEPEQVVPAEVPVYEPKLNPVKSGKVYDESDIIETKSELKEKIAKERNYIDVTCQHCGRHFSFIGEDKGLHRK